jgi:hypothetical protein
VGFIYFLFFVWLICKWLILFDLRIPEDSFTDVDKEAFKDPAYYKTFRHELESDLNVSHSCSYWFMSQLNVNMRQSVHPAIIRGSAIQQDAQKSFKENMLKQLAKKSWIADHCLSFVLDHRVQF